MWNLTPNEQDQLHAASEEIADGYERALRRLDRDHPEWASMHYRWTRARGAAGLEPLRSLPLRPVGGS